MVPINAEKVARILNRRMLRARKREPEGYRFFLYGLKLSLRHGCSPGYVLAQMQSPHWLLYVKEPAAP